MAEATAGTNSGPGAEGAAAETGNPSDGPAVAERPAGTDHVSEAELAARVDRDAMIGVTRVSPP